MTDQSAGPRIFSVERANRLLPEVRRLVAALRAQRKALQALERAVVVAELEALQPDGTPSPEVEATVSPRAARYQEGMTKLQEALTRLEALGGQLKDLEQGLVDFFTVHQGQLVYLCWKDGEDRIQFWHHLEDGFAGRRPIAELANN